MDAILRICTKFLDLLKMRADCYMQRGDSVNALFDYTRLVKLSLTPLNDVSIIAAQLHLGLGTTFCVLI